MENINITVSWSIDLHIFIFWLTIILGLVLITFTFTVKNFTSFYNKHQLWFPQYNILIASIAFTGIIVMAMENFMFGVWVWLMIFIWLILLAMAIKLKLEIYKITNEIATQERFRKIARFKYSLDMILLFATYLIV